MSEQTKREPSLLQASLPIMTLIVLLFASVQLYSDSSSSGPNQIALLLSAGVGIIIGMRNGYTWKELEKGIVHGISLALGAALILLVVGSLIGTWILSGIVPTMIYYGLKILNPTFFYPLAAIICAIVALATGSSWSTASTVGIALIGIAGALGLSLPIAAGAIISGSYFGDKLSPLSDTTNLAPAMAGTDLITHIRHMLWTTIPSMTIALMLYFFIGLFSNASGQMQSIDDIFTALTGSFNIGWYLLIPPAIVFAMLARKTPALPALLIGALLGGLFAVIFQQEAILKFVGETSLSTPVALFKGFWTAMFGGYIASTGNAAMDSLLTRGGMANMLNTVWLIMMAMTFGGVMETTGILRRIAEGILGFATSTGKLIASTIGTSIGMNIIASDQYISIVIPGRMYREEFQRRKLLPKNLSRTLEDAGTLTSPMVPWNTCGAFMAQALGVATLAYLPFCFLGILNPIIATVYGFTGFTIEKEKEEIDEAEEVAVAT
ncbi:MAG: Na+/H+ antiporter NhaC [bacterium]